MGAALPYQSNCCNTCDDPQVQNVPGAKGDPGADGNDGVDGTNAYTTTTADFSMPDGSVPANPVTVSVVDSDWMALGQTLYVQNAGWMQVDAINAKTSIDLLNLEDGSGVYTENVAPTTVVTSGSKISPGGLQGPSTAASGAAGGDLTGTYPDPDLGITAAIGDIIVHNGTKNAPLSRGLSTKVLHSHDSETLKVNYRPIDLSGTDTSISGATPIANGGTGQTSKTEGFDALSPLTTKGDTIAYNGSDNVRVAVTGVNGGVYQEDSAQAAGVKFAKLGPTNFGDTAEEVTVETYILRHTENAGVDANSGTTDQSWQARPITEVSQDTSAVLTTGAYSSGGKSGNKFSFNATGYYRIHVDAVGYNLGLTRLRLMNVSTATPVVHSGGANNIVGQTVDTGATGASLTMDGRFQVTVAGHEFAIEMWCPTGKGSTAGGMGKGSDAASLEKESYMSIRVEKIAKS